MDFSITFGSSYSPVRPLRVLCAEDHEQMALLTTLVLQRAGHYVEHVADGQQAWERIRANPTFFDLIVTDHQMPHLTGLELTRKLRQARYAGKIVVYSSFLTSKEEGAFRGLQVDAILQKPASIRDLLRAVQAVA